MPVNRDTAIGFAVWRVEQLDAGGTYQFYQPRCLGRMPFLALLGLSAQLPLDAIEELHHQRLDAGRCYSSAVVHHEGKCLTLCRVSQYDLLHRLQRPV